MGCLLHSRQAEGLVVARGSCLEFLMEIKPSCMRMCSQGVCELAYPRERALLQDLGGLDSRVTGESLLLQQERAAGGTEWIFAAENGCGEQHCRICGRAAWELPPNLEQMDASIT